MQNQDYKSFRSCEEGDYNHTTPLHDLHVTSDGCDWCESEFYSDIKHIEQSTYLSIVMSVQYIWGGNGAHNGYNSLNIKDNKLVTIPSNETVKNILVEEIEAHLLVEPLIDLNGNPYPILDEIKAWDIDDLTFYFKSNTLRIIYNNGAYGHWNQTFDIPLPRLQKYLNL